MGRRVGRVQAAGRAGGPRRLARQRAGPVVERGRDDAQARAHERGGVGGRHERVRRAKRGDRARRGQARGVAAHADPACGRVADRVGARVVAHARGDGGARRARGGGGGAGREGGRAGARSAPASAAGAAKRGRPSCLQRVMCSNRPASPR